MKTIKVDTANILVWHVFLLYMTFFLLRLENIFNFVWFLFAFLNQVFDFLCVFQTMNDWFKGNISVYM